SVVLTNIHDHAVAVCMLQHPAVKITTYHWSTRPCRIHADREPGTTGQPAVRRDQNARGRPEAEDSDEGRRTCPRPALRSGRNICRNSHRNSSVSRIRKTSDMLPGRQSNIMRELATALHGEPKT